MSVPKNVIIFYADQQRGDGRFRGRQVHHTESLRDKDIIEIRQ